MPGELEASWPGAHTLPKQKSRASSRNASPKAPGKSEPGQPCRRWSQRTGVHSEMLLAGIKDLLSLCFWPVSCTGLSREHDEAVPGSTCRPTAWHGYHLPRNTRCAPNRLWYHFPVPTPSRGPGPGPLESCQWSAFNESVSGCQWVMSGTCQ